MSDIVYNDTPPASTGAPSGSDHPDIAARPQPGNPLYGDIAAALPAPVRKKFKRLRDQAARARRAFIEVSQGRDAMRDDVGKLEDELSAMVLPDNERSHRGNQGRGLSEDSAEVRAAKLQIASLREDLDDLNARYSDPNNSILSVLVSKLDDYVRRHRLFGLARGAEPVVRKGEPLASAIETRRRRIGELKADLRQIELAPWPSKLTKARAGEQLVELAKRGRPDVFALVERFDTIAWPMLPQRTIFTADGKGSVALPETLDASALMAWALGPALVAAVEREIDELSDDDKALTAEMRKQRATEISAEILAVEREEEALIEMAEAQQLPIIRRTDADPRAVLGVS
jgi:hypothetical protein